MQWTSVTITNEKQSVAIKNKTIFHALSVICDVVDMSNKLNKSLSAISSKSLVEWIGILSLLICKSLDMEFNSFAWLKLHTPTSNLKLNKWSPIWLFYPYPRVSPEMSTLNGVVYCCSLRICQFHWWRWEDQRNTNRRPWDQISKFYWRNYLFLSRYCLS